MNNLRFCPLEHRGVITVTGPDRVGFLQGLVSNDVARAAADRAVYAALLTPQGRFQFDMTILAAPDGERLLLEVERARAADLIKRLSMFKLRSKVSIEPALDSWEVFAAFGPDAPQAFALDRACGSAAAVEGALIMVDPRLAELGLRVLAPRGTGAAMLAARGFTASGEDSYEALRLGLGIPDGSRDLPVDKALLLESGFDELNGVDWNKGCYMGQELTARTKYRGLVRKRLLPVAVEGPLPQPGTPILQGEREAGDLRSGRDGRALALLRLEVLHAAEPLRAGDAVLRPSLPGWIRLPPAEERESG